MNPSSNLIELSDQFKYRVNKLRIAVHSDQEQIERYCIVSIALLNNFLRAYLLSLRLNPADSRNVVQSYPIVYSTQDHLIDEFVRVGNKLKWKPGRTGAWVPKDEPAFHTPYIFSRIVSTLNPSNKGVIQAALTDSWKIDVLRAVRNYFAHRSRSTEEEAIRELNKYYSSLNLRASKALVHYDVNIASTLIDDIHSFLIAFAEDIC